MRIQNKAKYVSKKIKSGPPAATGEKDNTTATTAIDAEQTETILSQLNSTVVIAGKIDEPIVNNNNIGNTVLVPTLDIIFPEGATHVSFSGAFANINYATGVADVKLTNSQNLPISATSSAITLTPTAVPTGTGAKLFLLKIEFFQIVNSVQYSLKNGAYNALKLIEVI
jgi:hypothetical protein